MDSIITETCFTYHDAQGKAVLQQLIRAYARQVFKILDEVAEESCLCHSSHAIKGWPLKVPFSASYHNKSRSWKEKIHRYGRKAFAQVNEDRLMRHWKRLLDRIPSPAHPSEYPELVSPVFRWAEVINEEFIKQVMRQVEKYCPPPNPYQIIVPDYLVYKPPVIWIDADSDTELIDTSDSEDMDYSNV